MNALTRLVYVSTTTQRTQSVSGDIPIDVGRILMQSRQNNPKLEIGGVLYFSNDYFFQCLEGAADAVNQLYSKIADDPRHQNTQILSVKSIHKRQFSEWSMKYVTSEDRVNHMLDRFGLKEFNPYLFDEYMVDEMLYLFTQTDDAGSNDVPSAKKQPDRKKGFLARLFG